jgi:isoleucyl-tRNA synthetase
MLRLSKTLHVTKLRLGYKSSLRFARFASNESSQHQYSNTVFLPNTEFGSRSDQKLIDTVLKPQTMEQLYDWNIKRPLKDDDINNLFILHDGPPYANSNLHVGHALNKILKDIITRYELMLGKKVHYVPGWDCHGLPIELKTLEKLSKERKEVEKKLKKDLKKANIDETEKAQIQQQLHDLKHSKLSKIDIVKLATEHALSAVSTQSKEFQEMGVMGDFNNPYLTLKNSYITDQLRIFKKFFDNGLVHRQEKPVYWGCENATALAEGELEYNSQHKSKAAYVKFPIIKISEKLKEKLGGEIVDSGISALIWTSTPWTLASNLAISINEDFDYTIIKSEKFGNLVVSNELVPSLSKFLEFTPSNIYFKGQELLSCEYSSEILNDGKTYPFLHGTHVTNGTGTGLVHTAPGHGQDDYIVCLKNGIKPYSPVDNYGKYTNEISDNLKDFVGLKVLTDGNSKMIEKIQDLGILIHLDDNYIHSYPYDWRSKKPIIIRATPQWFIDVSKIKDITISQLNENVKFHPSRGINRLSSFIRNRNEWCISRQRSWGVPIPVLYHRETGEVLLNDEIIEQIIKVIEEENIDGWFKQVENKNGDISRWLPLKYQHLSKDYTLGTDTMDVWFDSGSSWTTIEKYLSDENLLDQVEKRGYLADIYLEGSDQHRGWFQSSVLTKIGTSNKNESIVMPYKGIVTHGFTLDEKGEKMSKSIGNTISPNDILNGNKSNGIPKVGIDGLRLWVAQSDYTNDVNIGSTILKHVGDNLKKIRFTFKFLLGNLKDFEKPLIEYHEMNKLDQYILSKLWKLNKECQVDYEQYNYFKIIQKINHFINVDLSSIYFDIRKDSLYTDKLNSNKRISTLCTFEEILQSLVSILSPIIPIITQEVWNNMSKRLTSGLNTPFHSTWYNNKENNYIKENHEVERDFTSLLKYKDNVNLLVNGLKDTKVIRSALETVVTIPANDAVLMKYSEEDLCDIFVVSEVLRGDELKVEPSSKCKCPRCWKHNAEVEGSLCRRCSEVVSL